MTADNAWWHHFFDEQYADFGLVDVDDVAAALAVDQLVDLLDLQPNALIFDQCCGIGRIALPLAARGFRVIGVDITASYIARARAAATEQGLADRCRFEVGDAYESIPPEPCDAAINWFTSFGYTDDEALNGRMVSRAFDALRPGGRLVMETINMLRVLGDFRPQSIERRTGPDGAEIVVLVEREIDAARGMMPQTWTFLGPDGTRDVRTLETSIMLPHELRRLIERTGFTDVVLHGGPDGRPFDRTSRRLILTARRPG